MRTATRQGGPGRLMRIALGAALLAAWIPPVRGWQESPSESPPEIAPTPGATASDEPPRSTETEPQTPPDQIGPFRSRSYTMRPGKLWKALLPALQAAGYPLEEIDRASMTVKTSFVDFEQKAFQGSVADPPPRMSGSYRLLQMNEVRQGKVSLEASVSPKGRGSELRLRARILAQALDRQRSLRILVDRRSTGVIESDFLQKLEDRLGRKRT
jgi:hypothetical protein